MLDTRLFKTQDEIEFPVKVVKCSARKPKVSGSYLVFYKNSSLGKLEYETGRAYFDVDTDSWKWTVGHVFAWFDFAFTYTSDTIPDEHQ